MSTEDDTPRPPSEPSASEPLRGLVRQAFADTPLPTRDLLKGVQRRIRERTRGRYYARRWSFPRSLSLLFAVGAALVLLAVLALSYLVLRPLLELEQPASPKGLKQSSGQERR